jgi:hypothetical protein
MTMEILFFIFEVKFGQAAPSKSAKRKSHLLPEYSSDRRFSLQNDPQTIILNLTEEDFSNLIMVRKIIYLSSKIR